jgi:hypothetical protein
MYKKAMNIRKLTPAVDKRVLVLLAGLMWCGVGIMLVRYAVTWLSLLRTGQKIMYYAIGYLIAIPIHLFGFSRIAEKNINRLMPVNTKRCVFAFMSWKSYIIVLVMVSMGITLRHSSLPKQYLSVVYNGIGLALFLSGLKYLKFFFKLLAT